MIYKQISSKVIIGRVFEQYNVDYSGFVSRVPNYVHSAMRELKIYTSLISKTVDAIVADYKCTIPDDCTILEGVSYLGLRLKRTDTINQKDSTNMPNLISNEYSYEVSNNGYIITTFKESNESEFKFYIKTLPIEYDHKTKLYFPLIPDNEDLVEALSMYVIKRLLQRGHKVGEFSLKINNPYLNPGMAWDRLKKVAKNSILSLDGDDRQQISELIRTFLVNKNYYYNEEFNTNNR